MRGKMRSAVLFLLIGFTVMTVLGCGAKVKQSGFLENYPTFEKGPQGGADLRYLKPGVDFKKYNKIMMDHVVFYFSKDSKYNGINSDELNQLSEAFHKAMIKELQGAYPLVQEPGPGVLRIRAAIKDVKTSKPVLNTITTIVPAGLALSIVKKGVTGTHSFVGEASMEAEFLDSRTNERVAAVIDKRSGAKYEVIQGMSKWGHAEEAFEFWAKRLRKWLDEQHGK